MNHNPKAYLFDIKQACDAIAEFTRGMTWAEYLGNAMAKAAVERKFLTIGEALIRLRNENPEVLKAITDHEKVIGFRNVLVHGYDIVDDAIVWSAVKDSMPILQEEVERLLGT
ncbi:MAG: HepT-like ribonuclease domain-containing protein [Thermodesulfobacteriota bacterium]